MAADISPEPKIHARHRLWTDAAGIIFNIRLADKKNAPELNQHRNLHPDVRHDGKSLLYALASHGENHHLCRPGTMALQSGSPVPR